MGQKHKVVLLGAFPAFIHLFLGQIFEYFSDYMSDTNTTDLSNQSHSFRFLSTEMPNEIAVHCHLTVIFRAHASPESILNCPQQASAETFAGNFASPQQSHRLLYFHPKLNLKSPSSLSTQLLPDLCPSVSILPAASGPQGCAALCTLQKIAVSVS